MMIKLDCKPEELLDDTQAFIYHLFLDAGFSDKQHAAREFYSWRLFCWAMNNFGKLSAVAGQACHLVFKYGSNNDISSKLEKDAHVRPIIKYLWVNNAISDMMREDLMKYEAFADQLLVMILIHEKAQHSEIHKDLIDLAEVFCGE